MVKADLIRRLQTQLNLSRDQAQYSVECVLETIKHSLADGRKVLISGFGQWEVRQKSERMGRNPRTNEAHLVSSRQVVSFHASPVWLEDLKRFRQSGNSRRP